MTSRRDLFSGLFRKPNGPYLVLDGGNPPSDPCDTWRYPLVSVGFRRVPPQEIRSDIRRISSSAGRVFAPPVTDGKAARTTFVIASLRTEISVIPPYPGVRPDYLLDNFLDLRSIYSDATFGAFEYRNYPQEYKPGCPWWGFHLRPPMFPTRAEHRNAVEFFKFDEQQRRGITGGSGTWLSNLFDELYDTRDLYEDDLKTSLSQAGDPNGQRLKALYGNTLPFFDPTERGDYKSWTSWAQGRDAIGHTLRYTAEIKAICYWYDEVARQARYTPGTPVDRAPTRSYIGTWVGSVDTPMDWEFLYRSPLPLYALFTIPFTSSLRKLRATGELHGDEAYRVGAFPRNFPAAISRHFPPDPHQDCIEVGVNHGDPFTQTAREEHNRHPAEEHEPWPELQTIKVPNEYQTAETTAWNRPFYTYPFLDLAIVRYPPYEPRPPGAPPSERERLQNSLQNWWEGISREMAYRRPIVIEDRLLTNCQRASSHPLAYFVSASGNKERRFIEEATPDGVFRWVKEISKRKYNRDKADIYDDEEQYPHIYRFLGDQVSAFLHTSFPWPCEGEFVPVSGRKWEDDFPLVFPPPGKCIYLRREPPNSELSKLLDFEESLPRVVPPVSYETRDEILGPPIETSSFRHQPPSKNLSPQIRRPLIHELLSGAQGFYHPLIRPQPIASRTSGQPARGSDRGAPDSSRNIQSASTASPLSHRGPKMDKSRPGSQLPRDRTHPYRYDGPPSSLTRRCSPSEPTSSLSCQSSQPSKPVVPPLRQTTPSPGVPPPILQAKKALIPKAATSQAPTAAATTQSTFYTDSAMNDPGGHDGTLSNPPPVSSAHTSIEASSATANSTVSITEDAQDITMVDQSSIDQEVLMTVESRRRSNAYINGRLNRSVAPQTQSRDIVQARFSLSPESELMCYPMRISNIYAPNLHTPQAVIDRILGLGTAEELESVPIICGLMDADGTFCVDLGFTYAEDAMSLLVDHGSEMLRAPTDEGHVWHVSPTTRIAVGRSCKVNPKALGCLSPRPISKRRRLLREALSRERKIEAVDLTVAHLSCIAQMESLLTAIETQDDVDCNPQDILPALQKLEPFSCSLTSITDKQWSIVTEDSALLEFQSQWPPPGRTVAQPPCATQKANIQASATVIDEKDRQMTSTEVLKARRATWARINDLYEAWRSDKIPLPSIPVPTRESAAEDAMALELGQQGETSTRRQWKDLKRQANSATKALEEGSGEWSERSVNALRRRVQRKQDDRQAIVARHNARNDANRAATNNEFILVWDWYEACMPIIESARVSMAIPAVAWPHDLKPMDDKERAACVLSQSFAALQREFSPSSRWPQLKGPRLEEIKDLLKSRQSEPRHGSCNEPAASADLMDTT